MNNHKKWWGPHTGKGSFPFFFPGHFICPGHNIPKRFVLSPLGFLSIFSPSMEDDSPLIFLHAHNRSAFFDNKLLQGSWKTFRLFVFFFFYYQPFSLKISFCTWTLKDNQVKMGTSLSLPVRFRTSGWSGSQQEMEVCNTLRIFYFIFNSW